MGFLGFGKPSGPSEEGAGPKAEIGKALIEKSFKQMKQRDQQRRKRERTLRKSEYSEEEKQELRVTWSRANVMQVFDQMQKVSVDDFEELEVIGRGAFGTVSVVKHGKTDETFAMKSLLKEEMKKREQVARVWLERAVLISAVERSAASCTLHYAFQDEKYLYMVMDFLPGGDMLELLAREKTVEEDFAKFYMAELILALENIHRKGLIHRDVKPDNILFTEDGHLVLSDFGLCKRLPRQAPPAATARKTRPVANMSFDGRNLDHSYTKRKSAWRKLAKTHKFSTVGTPNYMAPEILAGESYYEESDWWSVGCIMYELLFGFPPFCGGGADQVCARVMNWQQYLYFPGQVPISKEAQDLLSHLLCEKEYRLGSQFGAEELQKHPFFAGVDWMGLHAQTPPFVPELAGPLDFRYFETGSDKESTEGKHTARTDNANTDDANTDDANTDDKESSSKTDSLSSELQLANYISPVTSPGKTGVSYWEDKRTSFRKDHLMRNCSKQDIPFAGFTFKRPREIKSRATVSARLFQGEFSSVSEEEVAVKTNPETANDALVKSKSATPQMLMSEIPFSSTESKESEREELLRKILQV